jgi:hypothetical protein
METFFCLNWFFLKHLIEGMGSDVELNDMYYFLMSIRCINDYLNVHPYLSSSTNENGVLDEKNSSSNFQYINNLSDHLTLNVKDFLNDFSQTFSNINNSDGIEKNIQQIFDLLEINGNKKFPFIQNDFDNQMGKRSSFLMNYFIVINASTFLFCLI